jgi:hypothetical protein
LKTLVLAFFLSTAVMLLITVSDLEQAQQTERQVVVR